MLSVIAIDGPAGAGKSTVADAVAKRLGFVRLDTGAMYRAVTFEALARNVDLEDSSCLTELADALELSFGPEGILIDGVLREREIRTPEVSANVSRVSRHRSVRAVLIAKQRQLAGRGGAVIEGRDIGSVVAPDAQVKVFLTAAADERAKRRHVDLLDAGHALSIDELEREVAARDERDHKTTPLIPASGAVIIDSTGMTIEQVVDRIVALAKDVGK